MGRTKGTPTTVEGICLTTLKSGESFYTEKTDREMTAAATYYKVKITTSILLLVDPLRETMKRIVKVTVINRS